MNKLFKLHSIKTQFTQGYQRRLRRISLKPNNFWHSISRCLKDKTLP